MLTLDRGYEKREPFTALVERHHRAAYAIARSIVVIHEEAEDVVQTAFLKAYTTLERVAAGAPFAPWFFRIVVNTARDNVRRQCVRRTEPLSDADSIPSVYCDPAERAELRSRLDQALSTLPDRMRAIVVLSTMEDYSHAEVADMFSIPQGTARSELWHGRRRLRQLLSDLWIPDVPHYRPHRHPRRTTHSVRTA